MGRGGAQLGKPLKGGCAVPNHHLGSQLELAHDGADRLIAVERSAMLQAFEEAAILRDARAGVMARQAFDHLKRSRQSSAMVHQMWREILRQLKLADLQRHADTASIAVLRYMDEFDGQVNSKLGVQQSIDCDLKSIGRVQFQHLAEMIDKVAYTRFENVRQAFDELSCAVRMELGSETGALKAQHMRCVAENKSIHNLTAQADLNTFSVARQQIESDRETLRNMNLENINGLRISLDAVIEELERCFEQAHRNYTENTNEKTKHFQELTDRDRILSDDIDSKIRRIESLNNELISWRKKLNSLQNRATSKNQMMKFARLALLHHYEELRSRERSVRQRSKARLISMTTHSNEACKKLKGYIQSATRILQGMKRASELEQLDTRLLPFYLNSDGEKASTDDEVLASHQLENGQIDFSANGIDVTLSEKFCGEDLVQYWKRFNMVQLEVLRIRQVRDQAKQDHAQLKSLLKNYLASINVSSSTFDNPNSLFIVNGVSNVKQSHFIRKNPRSIVEGNAIITHYTMHSR